MAERSKSSQNVMNIFGTVLCSTVDNARIRAVKLPDLDKRFTVLRASDLLGENVFSMLDGTMPILADDNVLFRGQPILAIFGPDYEAVSLAARETVIEYDESVRGTKIYDNSAPSDTDTLIWGESDDIRATGLRKVESEYRTQCTLTCNDSLMTIPVWIEKDAVHVNVPTQWPEAVRKNVVSSLGRSDIPVMIHPTAYSADEDEYLIVPALFSCIAANAAMIIQSNVELRSPVWAASPTVTVKHSTYITEDGKPVGEEAYLTADLGACMFCPTEFRRQALTGLIPSYPVGYFRATVRTVQSSNPPSVFCRNMGYSDAMTSSELQMSRIASAAGLTPIAWKKQFAVGKRKFTDYLPSLDTSVQLRLCEKAATDSNFARKWSSYENQRGSMSLIPFSRGIGMASGFGISGFSTTFARTEDFNAALTFTVSQNVELSTSLNIKGNVSDILKKLINSEAQFAGSDVIIKGYGRSNADSGPDVLARSLGQLTRQVIPACRRLSSKIKKTPPPVTVTVDIDDMLNPCEFDTGGTVAAVVEVRVDKISFMPVVQEAWVNVRLGTIYDMKEVRSRIRQAALMALQESGAVLSTDPVRPFCLNISVESDNTYNIASVSSAVSGCVRSAFGAAVLQSVPRLKNVSFPITCEVIQNSLKKN